MYLKHVIPGVCVTALLGFGLPATAQFTDAVKGVGHAASETGKKAVKTTGEAGKQVGSATKQGAKKAGSATKKGAKTVGTKTKHVVTGK